MYTQATLIAAILAVAEARFGQESVPVSAISALTQFGEPGAAGGLSGAVPGVLLAAADPCDKLTLADQIVTELGTDQQVIAAARQLVAAEQNFNPFTVSVPAICGDAALPATPALRGIVPLVDPAVAGADVENANSAASLKTPLDAAAGLSAADSGNGNAAVGNKNNNNNAGTATTSASATATTLATVTKSAGAAATTSAAAKQGAGAVTDAVTGNFAGFQASSKGLDFGTCVPTVKFEAGLNGRSADEATFQAQDPVVNQGQQEALNPDIIFNRICDQLTNVCGAAADAVAACQDAQARLGGGAKDASTARKWNTALGFQGVSINPDNAPKEGLVGHT
ncbi:hypothetical protein F4780DRAFT_781262 [Xylariomycetidae sp. FL0641]|nr:hypothetical protein F4780DRAFT_781262 [Xylariomycetidae sp. FL0641]